MIGTDFEKIQFVAFGLDLVEPMSFVTDIALGALSIYFGIKVSKLKKRHPFYQYWVFFFIIFGIGTFYGGFAHVFYNYMGWPGKTPSWLAGPLSVYCIEQAMISVHPNRKVFNSLKVFSFWKLIIVLLIFIFVLSFGNLAAKPSLGFLPIALNTIVGVSLTAGALGFYYYREGDSIDYKYFVLGVLVMLPSALVFLLKINLHQWFDKNDLSHVLLGIGITYFYSGIKRIHNGGILQDTYL